MKSTDKKTYVFTIIAKNYYKHAHLLIKSYLKNHPDHNFLILFIDNQKITVEGIESININEILNIPHLIDLQFKYDITEYSTAVKPFFIDWVIREKKADYVIYLDPDIYIFKPIHMILDQLKNYDCVLIPHITEPYKDEKNPTELDIGKSGLYNLGFAAFRIDKNVIQFIKWWENKVYHFGFSDPDNYMFTDQKWMDYAPLYLNICIFKDKGFNVAYWNLHEYVNKFPIKNIVFFHYSGFYPQKHLVSKYQNRFTMDTVKEYVYFFEFYEKEMNKIKKYQFPDYQYEYNFFSNKTPITKSIRKIYSYIVSQYGQRFSNPFNTENENSFFHFLINQFTQNKLVKLPNLLYYLYKTQTSIRNEFPNLNFYDDNIELRNYIRWFRFYAEGEYDIPYQFLQYLPLHPINSNRSLFYEKHFQMILLAESIKKNYINELFVEKIYRLLLKREPDTLGFNKNVDDLINNKASKNKIIYRILKSNEFRIKNKSSVILDIYRNLLFSTLPLIFLINLLSKKIHYVITNDKNSKKTFQIKGINIAGYLDTESGVGESCRGLIAACQQTNLDINLNKIDQIWLKRNKNKYSKLASINHGHPINLICVNADQMSDVIINHLKKDYIKNRYNIGYWYWESDIFPQEYHQGFQFVNEIWVATDYIYNSLCSVSNVPIVKIPPSFTPPQIFERFDFHKYGLDIPNSDFVFLNLFDSASFWERKNPFDLIHAFNSVYKNKKGIKLIIKTTNIKTSPIYEVLKNTIINNNNIFLLDGYLPKNEIIQLENRADCYVALHRSEGLGIPLIESMMLHKPVIATDFGGNTDFMDINSSFPVRYTIEKLNLPIGPYPKNTSWASPDIEHAAYLMNYVYTNHNEVKTITRRGYNNVTELYNPSRIGKLILSRLLSTRFLY